MRFATVALLPSCAPAGPHAWLNATQFAGSVAGGPRPGTVIIRVFRILWS